YLDNRTRGLRGRPIRVVDLGPACRAGLAVNRILGFGDGQFSRCVACRACFITPHSLALIVAPQDARQHRASLRGNVRDAAECSEVVVVAALDGESPRPMSV